jgi:CheY-like chemotaxis protein
VATNGRSHYGAPKILCLEPDLAVRESRCAVLNVSGYDAASATPHLAEIVLRRQKFDLIVLARMSDHHQERIINLADGVDVLVLDGITMPLELLWLVGERLSRLQQRA